MEWLPALEGAAARAYAPVPAHAGDPGPVDEALSGGVWTVFQPIYRVGDSAPMGLEGYIRGPRGHVLERPEALFRAARESGRLEDLERAARASVLQDFAALDWKGRIFVNVHPGCLPNPIFQDGAFLEFIHRLGLHPGQVVLELTEHEPVEDVKALRAAVRPLADQGMGIALDDVGAGFASMRLLCELGPDFVKLDKFFVASVHENPVKRKFIRGLVDMAKAIGAQVAGEGVEREGELNTLLDLGVDLVQGYLFAKPQERPSLSVLPEGFWRRSRHLPGYGGAMGVAGDLLRLVPSFPYDTLVVDLHDFLLRDGRHQSIVPVYQAKRAVGLISRAEFMERMSRRYALEILGRHPIMEFVRVDSLIVDEREPLERISRAITGVGHDRNGYTLDHFVITHQGAYAGVGRVLDLLERITAAQLEMARYANPLTGLPGNVPIQRRLDQLLAAHASFTLAYCDLDNFKAFNDHYGYARGDRMIKAMADLLVARTGVDPVSLPPLEDSFVGHVGGDDFVLILPGLGHEPLLNLILEGFGRLVPTLYDEADREAGGVESHDRQGNAAFFPIATLSIAVVPCPEGRFRLAQEIAQAASEVKAQAKRMAGNTLFVDRRERGGKGAGLRGSPRYAV